MDVTDHPPVPADELGAEPVGEPAVDDALSRLEGLADRSLLDQVTVLDGTHAALRRVLDAPAS